MNVLRYVPIVLVESRIINSQVPFAGSLPSGNPICSPMYSTELLNGRASQLHAGQSERRAQNNT